MPDGVSVGAPRHVLLTGDAVGGVWRYCLELARGLGERGIRTTLAILGPPPGRGQAGEAVAVPGLRTLTTGLPLDWAAEGERAVRQSAAALARVARRVGADIVHLHTPSLVPDASWPVPVAVTVHSCIATWWRTMRSGPLPDGLAWHARRAARGLARAGAVIAPSRSFADAVAAAYDGRAATVVRNGCLAPAQPGRPRRCRFALTSGRLWDPAKGARTIDRAAARLDFPVYAAGPCRGPNGDGVSLSSLIRLGTLGAAEVAEWHRAAPVYVSASRYEPFGLAVLEAAQARTALVLSDIPTFRELWDGAAVFVPPGDDGALAAALDALFDAPDRLADLARRAEARAAGYSAAAMVEGTVAVYGGLLGERRVAGTA